MIKKIKIKTKMLQESIDLTKIKPNYFEKIIFRSAIFIIIFIIGVGLINVKFDPSPRVFIECPSDSVMACMNPYYECANDKFFDIQLCELLENTKSYENYSKIERVEIGESFGEKIPPYLERLPLIIIFIICLAFGLNHLLYLQRNTK